MNPWTDMLCAPFRVIFKKLSGWWRRYPQKKRVKIIAAVLIIFAGSEAIILAPIMFDIALMIDIGGMAFVFAAIRSSVRVSMMQLRSLARSILKPIRVIFRVGETMADWGSNLYPRWWKPYGIMNEIMTKSAAAILIVGIGLLLTKTFIKIV